MTVAAVDRVPGLHETSARPAERSPDPICARTLQSCILSDGHQGATPEKMTTSLMIVPLKCVNGS